MSLEVDWLLRAYPKITMIEALLPDSNGILRGKWLPRGKLAKIYRGELKFPKGALSLDIWGRDVAELAFTDGDEDGICLPIEGSLLPIPWSPRGRHGQLMLTMLKSDGTPWRPVVHIRDMALAFVATLDVPREVVHDEAFNVGRTDQNFQIRDLAEIVASVVPDSVVGFADGASADARDYRVNCDKIQDLLPTYRPQWTAERGAAELRDAYERIGLTLEEFEGPRYRRIHHVRGLLDTGRLDARLRWTDAGGTT